MAHAAALCTPVVDKDPERVHLGHAVRGAWVEGRGLALGHLVHLAKHLGGGGLVDAGLVSQASAAHSLQQVQSTLQDTVSPTRHIHLRA